MSDCYIGLISGTSMDGIDAVIASFGDSELRLLATLEQAYPDELRDALQHAIRHPDACTADQVGTLDRRVGEQFRDAAVAIIEASGMDPDDIVAIGSHGQTLRHRPDATPPYSLQIGDAATIALGTGIVTVADFRRADIAAGGQGAPLVPPFHRWLFGAGAEKRVVLNIGGIANITVLDVDDEAVLGFDTGPGNALLDRWMLANNGKPFDDSGSWAAGGRVNANLLELLLADDYFSLPPPKSTGFEHFNMHWLTRRLERCAERVAAIDVQATLAELSARSIAASVAEHASGTRQVLVCGGGAHNTDLIERLRRQLPDMGVASTLAHGLHPDWVEAAAFAWLAMRTMQGRTGNLPSVTGAQSKVVLGAIHSA
ncbi:MAG: anhydro-N-acetylmuramic acid kinase [Gammaproteobacteria bacterium]|nr:anhydro-N-acetylmuramic acid kinase [Gammaproteobacteria bacterium]